jgi:hypothetical protein
VVQVLLASGTAAEDREFVFGSISHPVYGRNPLPLEREAQMTSQTRQFCITRPDEASSGAALGSSVFDSAGTGR